MKLINNYTANLIRTGSPLPHGAIPLAADQPASAICLLPTGQWIRWWPGTGSQDPVEKPWPRIVEMYLVRLTAGNQGMLAEYFQAMPEAVIAWLDGMEPSYPAAQKIADVLKERRHEGK